jgi:hypothetical protein
VHFLNIKLNLLRVDVGSVTLDVSQVRLSQPPDVFLAPLRSRIPIAAVVWTCNTTHRHILGLDRVDRTPAPASKYRLRPSAWGQPAENRAFKQVPF